MDHFKLLVTVLLISPITARTDLHDANALAGSETQAGAVGSIFEPAIISTDSLEFNACFSPDGQSFYFTRSVNKRSQIFSSTKTRGGWSKPEPVLFSIPGFSNADPAFSPTGELYFISNRPNDAADTTMDYDIWKVKLLEKNQ